MRIPRPERADVEFFQSLLPEDPSVQVRPMFGNEAAFVKGNMFMGLFGSDLFVRLSEADERELLKEEGASRFAPMKGRPMRGYVVIPSSWRERPEKVMGWVGRSLGWASGLPSKAGKKPKS